MAEDAAQINSEPNPRCNRRLWVCIAAPVLLVLWVAGALDDDGNIALVRNDVVHQNSDIRIWQGTMVNTTDSQYREIDVTIRFLDSQNQPVGEVTGRADQLEPGETLDLRAALPSNAARMQVYSLAWRTGRLDKSVGEPLGPWAPWSFGYVQTSWPDNQFKPYTIAP